MSDERPRDTWQDPIVAEVRKAREALFAEADYDIFELCRRLSDKQASSGHTVVKRGGAAVEESLGEGVRPSPRAKAS